MAEASIRFVPAKFPEPVNIQPGSYIEIKLEESSSGPTSDESDAEVEAGAEAGAESSAAEAESSASDASDASEDEGEGFWGVNENPRDRGSNGRISKSWETGARAPIGLVNRAVTCYMNSAIQCLIHVPAVARYLGDVLKNKYKETIRRDSVTYELALLYKKLIEAKKREIYPSEMIKRLDDINCMMSEWKQEDAHEYYMSLMGRLQEDSVPRGAKLNSSILYDIFGGTLKQHVVCSKCKAVSTTEQDIYDLSVGMTPENNIESSIREYFKSEMLKPKGKEGYFCEKCKSINKAIKMQNILHAPEYLNIQLKRFRFDGDSGKKLQNSVGYPMDLDLTSYSSSEPAEELKYQLMCVIEHSGRNLSSGHYIAYCRQPNNGWARYDDEVVEKVSERQIKKNANAYMLIYSRLTAKSKPRAKPKAKAEPKEPQPNGHGTAQGTPNGTPNGTPKGTPKKTLKRKHEQTGSPHKYTKLEATKKASADIDDLFKGK